MYKGNYLKGLQGLTKQDRANWEKQYSALLQGKSYNNDELNQIYLNTKFKEAFSNNSNYNTLKTLSQDERNKMLEQYNRNVAFKETFGDRKDYNQLKTLPQQLRNQLLDESYVQRYALEKYKNNKNLTDIMTLTPTSLEKLIDSGYKSEDELQKLDKQRKAELQKQGLAISSFGNAFGGSPSGVFMTAGSQAGQNLAGKEIRRQNEDLLSKIQVEDDKLKEQQTASLADKYHKELAENYDKNHDSFVFDFQTAYHNFAEKSNYYHAFKGDYTLNQKQQTDQQLKDYAKWQALKDTYGEAAAIGFMDRDFQKTVADKQMWAEKVANSTKNIFIGAAADIANDVLAFRTAYILATQGKEAAAKYMQGLNPDGSKIQNKLDDPTYWQGVDQFNTTSRREIEDIRSRGGISPYNNVVAPGEEYDLISMHTIDEAYRQGKHMLSGLATGYMGGKAASLLGKGASLISSQAGKYVGKSAQVLSYLNLGVANAQLEGLSSFQEARQAALERIDDIINSKEGQKEIDAYVERVRQDRKKKAGEKGKFIFDEKTVRQEGEQLYRQMLEKEADRNAVDAWASTATIDFLREAATNFAFKKYLLPKETREALSKSGKGVISKPDGTLEVKAPKTRMDKAIHKARLLKYPWDEFQEEVVDNTVNNFGQGLALAEFNDYANKTMNPTAYKETADNFIAHVFGGMDKATDALVDPQSYYEGFIGALSGGFGAQIGLQQLGNILKTTTKSGRESLKEQMKDQTWAEKINNFIVNPLINDIAEDNAQKRQAQRRVDIINELVKNNKENIDNIVSLITTSANIDEQMATGETEKVKDAKEDNVIAALNSLNVLSRDEFGKQSSQVTETLDKLNRLANGDISNEEINVFLGQAENKDMLNQEGSEQKAAERIQKNAQKVLDIYNTMDNIRNTISEHPNANNISPKAQQQLIYLGAKDKLYEDRINTMTQELSEQGLSLNMGEEQYNPLTKYQTKSGYDTEKNTQEQLIDRIQSRIDRVSELIDSKTNSLTDEKSEENDKTRAEIESLNLQKKDLQKRLRNAKDDLIQTNDDAKLFKDGNPEGVITKEQMATLSPSQLVEMIAPTNAHKYSQKQQDIIKEFLQDLDRKSPSSLEKIMDLYTLQLKKKFNNQTYDNILNNPKLYDYYIDNVAQDYQDRVEMLMKNSEKQVLFNKLDATSDEELHKAAINTSVAAIDEYIEKRPDRAPLLEQAKKVTQLREDATTAIDELEVPDDYKPVLRESMLNITEGARTQEEAINNLEDAIDSKDVDETTKNALNQLLNKMQELNYQRNATKVHSREVKKRRQEGARKAAETKRKKKAEKEVKDKAEAQNLLKEFDIPQDEADTIDGDIIGVTQISKPTKDTDGSAILKIKKGKKITNKKVTLTNKAPEQKPTTQIEEKPFKTYTTKSGKKVEQYKATEIKKDGTKVTKIVSKANGNEVSTPAANFPIPEEFEISADDKDAFENVEILGITELRERGDNIGATILTKDKDGILDTSEVKLQRKQKVLTPSGEAVGAQLEKAEDVDLGDTIGSGEPQEGQTQQPQGQQPPKAPSTTQNEIIIDGQVAVISPTEQQLLAEDKTGKVGTTDTPKVDNTPEPNEDPNSDTLKGNMFYGYNGDQLKKTGEQIPNQGKQKDDVLSTVNQWLNSLGARVQDIIDTELNDIIQALEDAEKIPKIQFMIVNENGKATQDDKLGNVVFNVIEYTDEVKRIHNKDLGGVIKAQNGKEYLIVGTLGYKGPNQSQSFYSIKDRLKINRNQSGNLNQRFYVDPNMYTQVAQIGRGWITRRLINDDGVYLRTISQLLNDPQRNPKGLKMEDLKWGIQMLTQFATVNVSGRNTISSPVDIVANSGSTFLLVEASNGKLIPVKIEPIYLNEMRDGRLKTIIYDIINNNLIDANYAVRRTAIEKLVQILSFNERNNILIGNEQSPTLSIVQDGIIVKTFNLTDPLFNRQEFIQAIEDSKFRISVTPNSLSSENHIKLLDEAGCLLVDVAKLGMSNADYSVYPVDAEGKPIIPKGTQQSSTKTQSNSDLQKTRYPSVRLFGGKYTLRSGSWYGFINGKETKIDDQRMIAHLMYNYRIEEGQLSPIKVSGNKETFILNADINNPEVVVRTSGTNSIEVLSKEKSIEAINAYNEESYDKRLKDAADQALKTGQINIKEDVDLGDQQQPSTPAQPIETKPVESQIDTDTDINKTGDKSLAELQGDQELTTAEAIITSDLLEGGSLLELIQSKFPELAQEEDIDNILHFLNSEGIPLVGIQNKQAFIDNIKNCK